MPGSIGSSEMEDASNDGKGNSKEGVIAATQFDDLILNAVPLVCKGERQGCRRQELIVGAGHQIKAYWSNKEFDISECEVSCVGCQVGVLVRPKKKEEVHDDHVGHHV